MLPRSPEALPPPVQSGFSPMIVCHCNGVSDRAIRESVRKGARSHREVALACGAGRSCGGCRPVVADVIADESVERTLCLAAPALAAAS
jgi:bacterioferritin-associated ferredoxin